MKPLEHAFFIPGRRKKKKKEMSHRTAENRENDRDVRFSSAIPRLRAVTAAQQLLIVDRDRITIIPVSGALELSTLTIHRRGTAV